jgi:hypothetical protein
MSSLRFVPEPGPCLTAAGVAVLATLGGTAVLIEAAGVVTAGMLASAVRGCYGRRR